MKRSLFGPRVLALVGDNNGPSLWRIFLPFTALEKHGYPAAWDYHNAALLGMIATAYDGYVLPRMSWRANERHIAQAWFSMVRSAGRFVVFDCDDDLFSTAMTRHALSSGIAPRKSFAQLEAERHDVVWAAQQCDGVTVSTEPLAQIVRALTDRPVIVVPNSIDVPWFRRVLRGAQSRSAASGADGRHVTIGWAGGRRDEADLAVVAEAWRRIAARYREVRFVVAGHRSRLLCDAVPADRLTFRPWVPIERYPAQLVGLDVGCAAVAETGFNAAKSDIKALEYALAGACVVATPTIYGPTIEHGVTGYLAETADDWTDALADLVEHPARRAIMARRLERQVTARRSLRENLWRWPAAWQQIADAAQSGRVAV